MLETGLKNHIALSSCEDIANITIPELEKYEVTVFNYYRIYFNGEIIRLSSDRAWTEHFFKKGYINQLSVPESYLMKPLNYYLWLTEDCPEMLLDAAINFDTSNGISIAKRHKDSIEYFCFATNTNNKSIINNFYLNNLDFLYQFTLQFKEQAKYLLKQASREKLIIPPKEADRSVDLSQFELIKKLSKRQLDCAFLLLKGMRSKEIAQAFSLSPRTVEFYIQNMKKKLNCSSQIELVLILSHYSEFLNNSI